MTSRHSRPPAPLPEGFAYLIVAFNFEAFAAGTVFGLTYSAIASTDRDIAYFHFMMNNQTSPNWLHVVYIVPAAHLSPIWEENHDRIDAVLYRDIAEAQNICHFGPTTQQQLVQIYLDDMADLERGIGTGR